MKYIVIGDLELIVFMPHIDHGDMFRRTRKALTDVVTGAGFISKDWRCYGASQGLGIGVGRTDQELVDFALRRGTQHAMA